MILDRKQIWAIFLFEFKMGCKAAEITCNINNAFGPRTAHRCVVRWWFKKFCKKKKKKKFCKEDESLEDEEYSGRPSEVDSDQLRGSSKLIFLQLHEKLPKNSVSAILLLFGI